MKLDLQWAYFDINSQQKFNWDKLDVPEDEAKTILKEAIRFWDREESFPSAAGEFPNLIKSHVKTFGFDSTVPGFTSKETCEKAGYEFVSKASDMKYYYYNKEKQCLIGCGEAGLYTLSYHSDTMQYAYSCMEVK